jgi:ABC-type sugar transport system substrate-binding protein
VRRILATAALAVSAVGVLTGCTGTTSQAPTPVQSSDLTSSDGGFDQHAVVGVVLRADSATPASGDEALADRFRTELTEAGFRPDVRVADGADPVASQRSAVRMLVKSGAKALLVQAEDAAALTEDLQTAHDAGVVVVGLGDQLPSSGTGGDGASADYSVTGTDSESELVDRAVDTVTSLQRGEKPATD